MKSKGRTPEKLGSSRRAFLRAEILEPRILLSATTVDHDADHSNGNGGGTGGSHGGGSSGNSNTILGTDGDDLLIGTGANENLIAGKGNDVLRGGSGNDQLKGGQGFDTADYSDATSAVKVDLTIVNDPQDTGGGGVDILSSIEKVIGSDEGDIFAFTAPVAGAVYEVDGGSGLNAIDLSNFSSSQATVDKAAGTITVALPGDAHFTIKYEDVAILQLSDAVMVLDGLVADAGQDVVAAEGDLVSLDATGSAPMEVSESHTESLALLPSEGGAGDLHGFSVAIEGDLAAVGSYRSDDGSADSGCVYLYQKVGDSWTEIAQLHASDADAGDFFGYSVALSGDTLIVGAVGDEEGGSLSGSAYIFRDTGSGWTQVAKLTADDAAPGDLFGVSVALSGNVALIGASRDDGAGESSGSVYVFEDTGSGWSQAAKLTASDAEAGDFFGHTLSISGTTAIVGSQGDDSGGVDSGSATIFTKVDGGWQEIAKLAPSTQEAGAAFGNSVAISGDTAIVGAAREGGTGAAYIFQLSGGEWTETARLGAPEGADRFGISVGIDDDRAVVGSLGTAESYGAVSVYRETPIGWLKVDEIVPSVQSSESFFGIDVSNSADTVIVGAPVSQTGEEVGTARIYERDAAPLTYSWVQVSGPAVELSDTTAAVPTFTAPEGSAGSELVFQVTVSDGTRTSTDTVRVTVVA
jgi:hypothetical protein